MDKFVGLVESPKFAGALKNAFLSCAAVALTVALFAVSSASAQEAVDAQAPVADAAVVEEVVEEAVPVVVEEAAQDANAEADALPAAETAGVEDATKAAEDAAADAIKKSGFAEGVIEYAHKVFVTPFANALFLAFLITVVGYVLGRIEIKGVGLGTAGVFLVALVFGHFGYADDSYFHKIGLVTLDESKMKAAMKLIQDLGLLCFVTSVGFIAGPKFFLNLKLNAKSYALLALVIIGTAALSCAGVIWFTKGSANPVDSAMAVGILSGSLTTTPGFAAACDALRAAPGASEEAVQLADALIDKVTVGHAIGYPFGVVGVVLFVQLVPKFLGADMIEEQKKLNAAAEANPTRKQPEGLVNLDPIGLGPFALAVILGIIFGKIYIPLPGGATFSLGNTGGALIMGLILGHFGHIGKINMRISGEFLKSFREFGLVMFLLGAGVPGGGGFVEQINKYGYILFVYGVIMTIVPMILGYIVARYGVKLCLLNNLGSITGGMTSTPALGALINTAKTDDVAAAYAATYPVALVLVVLASQFLVKLM